MNDQLSVKSLSLATLDAANFPGSAELYPRTVGIAGDPEFLRTAYPISSLSPTTIRIGHRPSKGNVPQRSLLALDQVLTRLDGSSQPTGVVDKFTLSLQLTKTDGCSEAEVLAGAYRLLGAALADNGTIDGSGLLALYRKQA